MLFFPLLNLTPKKSGIAPLCFQDKKYQTDILVFHQVKDRLLYQKKDPLPRDSGAYLIHDHQVNNHFVI